MAREGAAFDLLATKDVPALLDELQGISDHWLARKNTREKSFSLGCFDRSYLARLPVAVVRKDGRIVAFANVWAGEVKEEMSLDLMRYADDAPPGVMEYLFAQLMLWGRAQGYRWFSLGMAPLAGLEEHRPTVEQARRVALPPWRALLQLPGPARVQGQVRSDSGSRATWPRPVALPRQSRSGMWPRSSAAACRAW